MSKQDDLDNIVHLIHWDNNDSPFYEAKHKKFRKICRDFVDREVLPNIDKWSADGDVPKEFYVKCYKAGLYSRWYPKHLGGTPLWGNLMETFDPFYAVIQMEEFGRAGSAGLMAATWIHGLVIAPILLHGTIKQKKMMKSVICAEKFASLAVSEPQAGSDVKNITTTAKKNGDYYIISGEKYWITGGMKADYFLTAAVIIDDDGTIGGITLFLIERGPGVITTRLSLQGHDCSATAYVIFKNVRVHKSMIVGKPKKGFKTTMQNFNNERIGIIQTAVGLARVCVEESVRYAQKRETFGKKLIEHQIIRHKLAEMARVTLATHYYLENVCYRMKMKPFSVDPHLIRDVALLKVQATKGLEFVAREASQIFGGRSYIRGGRAAKIERIYRDVRALAIYGGSEEIMLKLAASQSKL